MANVAFQWYFEPNSILQVCPKHSIDLPVVLYGFLILFWLKPSATIEIFLGNNWVAMINKKWFLLICIAHLILKSLNASQFKFCSRERRKKYQQRYTASEILKRRVVRRYSISIFNNLYNSGQGWVLWNSIAGWEEEYSLLIRACWLWIIFFCAHSLFRRGWSWYDWYNW